MSKTTLVRVRNKPYTYHVMQGLQPYVVMERCKNEQLDSDTDKFNLCQQRPMQKYKEPQPSDSRPKPLPGRGDRGTHLCSRPRPSFQKSTPQPPKNIYRSQKPKGVALQPASMSHPLPMPHKPCRPSQQHQQRHEHHHFQNVHRQIEERRPNETFRRRRGTPAKGGPCSTVCEPNYPQAPVSSHKPTRNFSRKNCVAIAHTNNKSAKPQTPSFVCKKKSPPKEYFSNQAETKSSKTMAKNKISKKTKSEPSNIFAATKTTLTNKISTINTNRSIVHKHKNIHTAGIKGSSTPVKIVKSYEATTRNATSIPASNKLKKLELTEKNMKRVDKSLKQHMKGRDAATFNMKKKKCEKKPLMSLAVGTSSNTIDVSPRSRASSVSECLSPPYSTPNSAPTVRQTRSGSYLHSCSLVLEKSSSRKSLGTASYNETTKPVSRKIGADGQRTKQKQLEAQSNNHAITPGRFGDVKSKSSPSKRKSKSVVGQVSQAASTPKSSMTKFISTIKTRSQSRGKSIDFSQKLNDSTRKRAISESSSPLSTPSKKSKKVKKSSEAKKAAASQRAGVVSTPRKQGAAVRRSLTLTSQNQTPTHHKQQLTLHLMQSGNRQVMMVPAVPAMLDQQSEQHMVPRSPKGLWQINPSVSVQTVDPEDIVSDFSCIKDSDSESSSEEDEEDNQRSLFIIQMKRFKKSLDNKCSIM